jgi:hypothetical protein
MDDYLRECPAALKPQATKLDSLWVLDEASNNHSGENCLHEEASYLRPGFDAFHGATTLLMPP